MRTLASIVFTGVFALTLIVSRVASAEQGAAGGKPPSRWSLDEWLAQKQRNRLMDQWLAMQASSPYEFFVGADGTSIAASNDTNTTQQIVNNAVRAKLGAYASIVGLEASYESWPDLRATSGDGEFHLRLLGTSVRSTYLDIHYGLKYRDEDGEAIRMQGPGARLTLLLTPNFGISGSYDALTEATSDRSNKWSGAQVDGEVFIDFARLRVFGRYTKRDDQVVSPTGTIEKRVREGLGGGLKLFF